MTDKNRRNFLKFSGMGMAAAASGLAGTGTAWASDRPPTVG